MSAKRSIRDKDRLTVPQMLNRAIHLSYLPVQFDLEDVVEVGRAPAGGIVPAARGVIEQVVAAGDVVVRVEAARVVC